MPRLIEVLYQCVDYRFRRVCIDMTGRTYPIEDILKDNDPTFYNIIEVRQIGV